MKDWEKGKKVKVEYSGNIRYLPNPVRPNKQWKPYFPNVVGTLANKLSVVPSVKLLPHIATVSNSFNVSWDTTLRKTQWPGNSQDQSPKNFQVTRLGP